MTDSTNVETIENEIEKLNEPQIDVEKLNAAVVEYEAFKKELEEKQYIINGDKDYAKLLRAWLINDVKWSYSEVIAVTKLEESISQKIENTEFSLLAIEMRALNHLFQKTEGKGFHSAIKFQQIIMPIINVLSNDVKNDDDKLSRMQFKVSSLTEGIEPAEELMEGIE